MGNQVLKEFYRGNLSPADQQMVKGSKIARAVEELSKAENLLEQALTPDLLPILKRLIDAQAKFNTLTAETYYVNGFKTGARFIMAIQDDSGEDLTGIHT